MRQVGQGLCGIKQPQASARQPEVGVQRHWGWKVSKASGAGCVGSHGVAEIGGLWVPMQGWLLPCLGIYGCDRSLEAPKLCLPPCS